MQLNQCNILFAEDEEEIRENMTEVLELMANKVFTATDGLEALEIFNNENLDIIILDIEMPNLNGLEVAKKIRETNRDIPIIISTAYSTKEYLLASVELNLSTYILKPITITSLKEGLQKALANIAFTKQQVFHFSDCIYYDISNHILYSNGEEILLRNIEMQFLEYMLKNQNRVISYDEFENNIWEEGMSSPAIRSLVRDLRKYIPKESIINIARVGYKLELKK